MTTSTRVIAAQAKWPSSRWATLALGGTGWFAVMVLALHFLRPDLNPIVQPASAYALGPFGFLMSTAFFGLSLGFWALIVALARFPAPAVRSRAGLVLLGLWAGAVLTAMIFPMDPEAAVPTLSGVIHEISGFIGFFCLSAGAFLVSRRLMAAAGRQLANRALLIVATLMPLEYVGMAIAYASGSPFAGLGQRIFLVSMITWFFLTAGYLRSQADQAR